MINISDKTKCCGCYACYSICPKNAITMQRDEKGFEYPVVDKEKCIKCGLCLKTCPILNQEQENEKEIIAYACYNKNEKERLKSSSGGIFILIAKKIIEMGGVVFGACFDENFHVKHSYAKTEEDLKKFMTSKYVQSKIGETYKEVKEFLNQDKYVYFTGTPCQVEGLKRFLKKDYDKLYTQDIICHGVPSPKVWEKYLEYRKKVDRNCPVHINFRQKDDGWTLFSMVLFYNTGAYKQYHKSDLFMQAFLRNACLRDSCYNCSFKKKSKISDITLADYWGVTNIHPELNDNKGISLMIVNTKKGIELFDLIKNKIEYTKTNFEKAISYNRAYFEPPFKNPKTEEFFSNLDKVEFNELVKKYAPIKKVSISKKIIKKIKKILKVKNNYKKL